MKKKWLGLALTLVMALVAAALLLLVRDEPRQEDVEDGGLLLSGAAVERVEIECGGESYALVQSDGTPAIAGMEDVPLDGSRLRAAMDRARTLPALSHVAQGNLAEYGLDRPSASVRVSREDGRTDLLQLGSAAPNGAGFYATADGQNVYLVADGDASLFLGGPLAFADLAVVGGTQDSVYTALALDGQVPQRPFTVTLAEEQAGGAPFAAFDIAGPVAARANVQLLVETFQPVFGLRADSVQALLHGPDELADWGLAEPYSVLTVTPTEGDTFTLRASRPDGDGAVYLTRDGVPLVYRVDAARLPWLEVRPFDIMSKIALAPHIETVQSIEVETEEADRHIALTGAGETLAATVDGQPVDSAQFRKYYQLLLSASYDAETDESPADLGAPVLRVIYAYRDADLPADTLSLYPGPPRQLYIQLNDGPLYLCRASFLEKLVQNTDYLLRGEPVEEP